MALFSKNSSLLLQWNLNTCLRVKFQGVGWNESPRVRSLLVTAQLVLQVVSDVVSYACLAVSWQV